MTEKVTRRSFFRLVGGAAALVAVPSLAIANIKEVFVEYGFTWAVKPNQGLDLSLSDIVAKTLRENNHLIRDNLAKNNTLFLKLKNNDKIKINIEKISSEEQTKRIIDKLEARKPKHLLE